MAKTTKSSARKSTASANGTSKKSVTTKKSPAEKQSGESAREELMKLFEHALKDIYWVEKTLTKSIPKMIRKASSEKLVEALEDHLEVTEQQANKLERVFDGIDKAPRGKKCVGMEGILKEGEELMTEFKGPALDAAIIAAAQKVEHYEISSYNSMITLARTLDLVKEADILQSILNQEEEADKLLSNIAVTAEHHMAIGE